MGIVVRRYIDILIIIITFPYSTCISSFFGSNIPISLFILKMFFRSWYTEWSCFYRTLGCSLRPVHTAHSMHIQSGLMRIGLRSHCQGVNAH